MRRTLKNSAVSSTKLQGTSGLGDWSVTDRIRAVVRLPFRHIIVFKLGRKTWILPSGPRRTPLALTAVKKPLDMAGKAAQNAQKYAKPAAQALAYAGGTFAIDMNRMLVGRQLDPFLGPAVAAGTTIVAAGLESVAGGVAKAVPYTGSSG